MKTKQGRKIISEYDQERLQSQTQTTPWHRMEEPLNHHETPGRQIKQLNYTMTMELNIQITYPGDINISQLMFRLIQFSIVLKLYIWLHKMKPARNTMHVQTKLKICSKQKTWFIH